MATIKDLLGKMIEKINDVPKKLSDLEIDMEIGGEQVQSDWNQNDETAKDYIKNKPFGETTVMGDTLTWDGNTEGLEIGGGFYFKVSDVILKHEDFPNGCILTYIVEGEVLEYQVSPEEIIYDEGKGYIYIDGGVLIALKENVVVNEASDNTILQNKGIYFLKTDLEQLLSFQIPCFNGFERTEIKKIPAEYLPSIPFDILDLLFDLGFNEIEVANKLQSGMTYENYNATIPYNDNFERVYERIYPCNNMFAHFVNSLGFMYADDDGDGKYISASTTEVFPNDGKLQYNAYYFNIYVENTNEIRLEAERYCNFS